MGTFLVPSDVPSIAEAEALVLIEDAEAQAWLVAPCLFDSENPPEQMATAVAKSILRGVVLRWNDAGNGVAVQQAAGPFSQTLTPQVRRNSFWPTEIKDLQKVCRGADDGKAFSVDTVPGGFSVHAAICNLHFGAGYCSCGADIAGFPLWERDA